MEPTNHHPIIRVEEAMKEILDFAVQLAERAGEITLKYFRESFEIITKPDNSPVTIADRSAEEFIRAEIEKRFPQDGILGEEFGEKEGRSGYRWILDPIDGTKSFIRSVPLYGTMIAVEKDGVSQIGVVRFPPLNETIAALRGHGCTLNGRRCQVSSTRRLKDASVMMTSLDDLIAIWGADRLLRLIAESGLQRTWGDCFAYRLVANGMADVAIDPKVHIWDVAPLIPIIQESGGSITTLFGETSLNMPHVLATNGHVHEELLRVFQAG